MKPIDTDFGRTSRRSFIRKIAAGTAGAAVAPLVFTGCASQARHTPKLVTSSTMEAPPATVAVMRGTDRRQLIIDTIRPFEADLRQAIGTRKVVIKLNANRPDVQLIKTHPDAVRAILDVITPWYDDEILVGESTALEVPTKQTYDAFGYYDLEREYKNVKVVELNDFTTSGRWILTSDLLPRRIEVLDCFVDPKYFVISATMLKTHGSVVVTLGLKNVVMGAPFKNTKRNINFKAPMHGGSSPKLINLNLFTIAHSCRPHFTVLDGFVGAEGEGPNDCQPVDQKVAVAGFDVIAADRIGTELMGVPWENVGYLQWCSLAGLGQGERDKIKIIGRDPKELAETYALPKNVEYLYEWNRTIDWKLVHSR